MRISLAICMSFTGLLCLRVCGAALETPLRYICYRTPEPLVIDGRLDEPAWQHARHSGPFVDIESGEPAWYDSRVAAVWDEKSLYLGLTLEEPDVQATLIQRDSLIYTENDVEVFVAGRDAYYELELNALNTVYEVFWIWKDALHPGSRYFGMPEFDPNAKRVMTLAGVGGHVHPRGERWGFLDWDLPGLRHAVHVNGTLNNGDGVDKGWTVELALPWDSLKILSDGRPVPPAQGDVWRVDCARFQKNGPDGRPLKRSAGWTWNRHGYYDSHIPDRFTYLEFSDQIVGHGPRIKP